MSELEGKVAIVTGAGRLRGIGRTSALALAKLGADVVVTGTGRDPANYPQDEKDAGWRDIESTAEEIRALGRRALPLVSSASDLSDVEAMMEQTMSEFGRMDILINNAAAAKGADRVPIVDLDTDVFKRVVDVKVLGTFFCTRAFVNVAIAQGGGGKIVNISSTAGKRGGANTLAYNAANFAIVGMTQSMAHELGPHGINVNCVCPGAVETARMDDLGTEGWARATANAPIGRPGTPDEVGGLVAYLCTEAASWIHGQSINQNGGSVMAH